MSEEDKAQDVELRQREAEIAAQRDRPNPKPIKIDCAGCVDLGGQTGPACEHYRACVDDVVKVREAKERNGF